MTDTIVRRQPRGIPVGGQFATHDRADSDIELAAEPAEDSVFRKRYDTPEDKIKAFMEELETAVADLDTDEEWQRFLDIASKFHHYSFNNQMLIHIQRPDATKVAGFKKWQEMGRQVRKGEKGISILAPRSARVEVKDSAGRPVMDENGKPRKEVRVVGVTTATVFDISQTDGPDLPSNRMRFSDEPPAGLKEDLEAAIRAQGFTVEYSDEPRGDNLGFTTTDGSKRVVIQNGLNAGSEARVLAHELGHIAAGHTAEERVDEYHTGHGGLRGQMEVEADSISYALLRANGMTGSKGSSAAYIYGWGKRDPETIKQAGTTVAKAIKELLASTPFRNAE